MSYTQLPEGVLQVAYPLAFSRFSAVVKVLFGYG